MEECCLFVIKLKLSRIISIDLIRLKSLILESGNIYKPVPRHRKNVFIACRSEIVVRKKKNKKKKNKKKKKKKNNNNRKEGRKCFI